MASSFFYRFVKFLVLAGFLAAVSQAQVSYTGGTYTQDFNTLPSGGTFALTGTGPFDLAASPVSATGLTGWSFTDTDGAGNAGFFVGAGAASGGGTYTFGALNAADRALGVVASGSAIPRFGVVLINNTGSTITNFTVTYTGEQWRNGGNTSTQILPFSYAVGGTDINTGTFTNVTALGFTSPVATATAAALDGNLAANRTVVSSTVTGFSWEPGQTMVFRWSDANDAGNDHGLAIDDFSLTTGGGPVIPTVTTTTPGNNAAGVPVSAPITVSFNQAVNLTGTWFTLSGAVTGPVGATVSGGPSSFTLTPSTSFANSETVTLTILAAQVTDQASGTLSPAANHVATFTTVAAPGVPTKIHVIQTSGTASTSVNQVLTVSGVVTGFFTGSAGTRDGFYVQEEDADADADPATSEGIYVYTAQSPALASSVAALALGDVVTVVAKVVEFNSLTEMTTEAVVEATVEKTGTAALPAIETVTLPAASSTALERYENMRVQFTQTLTVTGNNSLGQFGELYLSGNGLIYQPTNVVDPNDAVASGTNSTTDSTNTNVAAVTARQAANDLAVIALDDATSKSYPDPTPYLNAAGTRRVGDTVTGLSGVLTYRFGVYRVDPQAPVTFVDANPRSLTPPSVGAAATLKVVSANVLNYFTTFGGSARGANNATEFARQKAKTVASLTAMNADIIGLMEIERKADNGALADLVAGLNAVLGAGTYSYIDSTAMAGTDAIQVALVYKSAVVTPVGAPKTDTVVASVYSRPPLAQTFSVNATGAKLTVVVNHFKSKGGSGSGADADVGDGQASFNGSRKQQATALAAYLATPTATFGDPDVLIVGDLNSYAEEDPIDILRAAGYADLLQVYTPGGYSYQFDNQLGYLDHALANASLQAQITGAAHWHINGDEPSYYDYNTENKSTAQQAVNVDTPFRSADHDPVIIGFNLAVAPSITQEPGNRNAGVGGTAVFSVNVTGTEPISYQWRKGTTNISAGNLTSTTASLTLSNVQLADAGDYNVVVSNSAGTVTSQNATLTVLTGFAGWQTNNFSPSELASPSVSGPNAVYGVDGLSNLVKYGLGLNPKQTATTGLPEAAADATHWTYTYTRPADRTDVEFDVERSSDLVTWTTEGVTHSMINDGGGNETWRATYPIASASQNFFRLVVTRPSTDL